MKRLDEFTDEELLGLTTAQIEAIIDRECAEEGVLLPGDRPVQPVTPPGLQPDVPIYMVPEARFTNPEDATKLVAFIKALESRTGWRYNFGAGYSKIAEPAPEDIAIGQESLFSAEQWAQRGTAVEVHSRATEAFKKDLKRWEDGTADRKRAADAVYRRVEQASADRRRRERMEQLWKRYVELADGDTRLAWKFLIAANPDAADVIPELAPPPEVAESINNEIAAMEATANAKMVDEGINF